VLVLLSRILLANRLDNRHASELELAILLLIAIEIALTLTNMAKQGLSVLLTSLTPIIIALVVLGIFYVISRRARVSRAKSLISVDTP
jgi:undecaprenyl pyrophosphate phosphatase UppP